MTQHNSNKHHEEAAHVQLQFIKHVTKLSATYTQYCNPFTDRTAELLNIHTKDIMADDVVESMKALEVVGKDLYHEFVKNVISGEKPITDTLGKQKFLLFSTQRHKGQNKTKHETTLLKHNLNLFAKLYLSSQNRGISPDEFFTHENHSDPPSIAFAGRMRTGTKSDLIPCLEGQVPRVASIPPTASACIIDGAALVHLISPDVGATFAQYVDMKIIPYAKKRLAEVCHMFSCNLSMKAVRNMYTVEY